MPNLLHPEQIAFYRANHYVHAKGVIPGDTLELAERILRNWVDGLVDEWHDQGKLSDKKTHLPFERRLVQLWSDAGRPKYSRSPRRDLVGPDMYAFLKQPRLLDLAADVLGTNDVSVHGIFNARPKLPDQKWTDTPWHQDAQYYKDAENVHVVSIWMPLQPVTEFNSCLQVAPGFFDTSLREGVIDEETDFLGLTKEDVKQLKAVSIEMEPGDALLFTQLLPHRALPNRSDAVRWSMDVRYEATAVATASGKAQGFVARSESAPGTEESYEQWLAKWADIPLGHY